MNSAMKEFSSSSSSSSSQGRSQDFSQGEGARFFRNKTFSGIRNKSKEKGSKLKKKDTKLKKKEQN